ncbi:L-threonylcarbamoyladenylate synthase [Candidatus Pelagibacter sp.]|nr:L-threonylcarbamoyladenylate synthase [Candidatus Pelagibacter sp.]
MKNNLSNIKKAKKILDHQDCVAVPTETVYGLAANAYSDKAVKKIFKLKKRPQNNPLIVHYHNIDDLKRDCEISSDFLKLYKKFSPGPITYVLNLKKTSKISKFATNNKSTLAVRFPKHNLMRKLLKLLKYPLAAPSANLSTKVSSVCLQDVKDDFGNKLKFILDGGRASVGVESTIISLVNKPQILRLGGLEVSSIENCLNKKLRLKLNSKKISSPGQMKLHYSPGIPIRLNIKKPNTNEAYLLLKKRNNLKDNYYYLSNKGNLKEAIKNLYRTLRKIKKDNFKSLAVERIKNQGLGKTINDRLLRASKFNAK